MQGRAVQLIEKGHARRTRPLIEWELSQIASAGRSFFEWRGNIKL
jgi:hypothetical protein